MIGAQIQVIFYRTDGPGTLCCSCHAGAADQAHCPVILGLPSRSTSTRDLQWSKMTSPYSVALLNRRTKLSPISLWAQYTRSFQDTRVEPDLSLWKNASRHRRHLNGHMEWRPLNMCKAYCGPLEGDFSWGDYPPPCRVPARGEKSGFFLRDYLRELWQVLCLFRSYHRSIIEYRLKFWWQKFQLTFAKA